MAPKSGQLLLCRNKFFSLFHTPGELGSGAVREVNDKN